MGVYVISHGIRSYCTIQQQSAAISSLYRTPVHVTAPLNSRDRWYCRNRSVQTHVLSARMHHAGKVRQPNLDNGDWVDTTKIPTVWRLKTKPSISADARAQFMQAMLQDGLIFCCFRALPQTVGWRKDNQSKLTHRVCLGMVDQTTINK